MDSFSPFMPSYLPLMMAFYTNMMAFSAIMRLVSYINALIFGDYVGKISRNKGINAGSEGICGDLNGEFGALQR
jgi:hypothetical protein